VYLNKARLPSIISLCSCPLESDVVLLPPSACRAWVHLRVMLAYTIEYAQL